MYFVQLLSFIPFSLIFACETRNQRITNTMGTSGSPTENNGNVGNIAGGGGWGTGSVPDCSGGSVEGASGAMQGSVPSTTPHLDQSAYFTNQSYDPFAELFTKGEIVDSDTSQKSDTIQVEASQYGKLATSQHGEIGASQQGGLSTSQPVGMATSQQGVFPTGHSGAFPTGQPGPFPTGQPGPFPTGQPGPFPTSQPSPFPTSQPSPFSTCQPGGQTPFHPLHHAPFPNSDGNYTATYHPHIPSYKPSHTTKMKVPRIKKTTNRPSPNVNASRAMGNYASSVYSQRRAGLTNNGK